MRPFPFINPFIKIMSDKKENLVEIVPNDLGAKIRVSTNNPEFAHVLLRQQKTVISPKGWVNSKTVHALLHGKVESIQDIGIANKDYLPGQIVVKESTTPFNLENPDMDLKRAGSGDDALICARHGEPIYRKGFYDPTMLEVDEFVAHTNSEDIRNAMVDGSKEAEADFINSMISDEDSVNGQPANQRNLEEMIAEVESEDAESDEVETPVGYEQENTIGANNPFNEDDDEEEVDTDTSVPDETILNDDIDTEELVEVDADEDDIKFDL